jgi:uncharacterized membrane-anchored protein YhcB (DUF1043 family)
MDSATSGNTATWAAAFVGLIGVFISILVTILLGMVRDLKKKVEDSMEKLETKLAIVDHKDMSLICVENIRTAFASTYLRLDEKLMSQHRAFRSHSHTSNDKLVTRE